MNQQIYILVCVMVEWFLFLHCSVTSQKKSLHHWVNLLSVCVHTWSTFMSRSKCLQVQLWIHFQQGKKNNKQSLALYIYQLLASSATSKPFFHLLCLFSFVWQSFCLVLFPLGTFMMTCTTRLFLLANFMKLQHQPALCLKWAVWICEWCFWQPHYTSRSLEGSLNWDWSDSGPIQGVNETPKAFGLAPSVFTL